MRLQKHNKMRRNKQQRGSNNTLQLANQSARYIDYKSKSYTEVQYNTVLL